jgi:hypothetical protein
MSTLTEAMEAAAEAVAHDPRSSNTEASIALVVQAVDEFLGSAEIEALGQADAVTRARAVDLVANQVRLLISGLRDMLTVAAQTEAHGGPVSWAPPLADAIARLEAAFHDVPDLRRGSAPPIVRPGVGPPDQWRVEESGEDQDEALEDAIDLVRAQQTEGRALARGEAPLDWESVRRDLDLDRE